MLPYCHKIWFRAPKIWQHVNSDIFKYYINQPEIRIKRVESYDLLISFSNTKVPWTQQIITKWKLSLGEPVLRSEQQCVYNIEPLWNLLCYVLHLEFCPCDYFQVRLTSASGTTLSDSSTITTTVCGLSPNTVYNISSHVLRLKGSDLEYSTTNYNEPVSAITSNVLYFTQN